MAGYSYCLWYWVLREDARMRKQAQLMIGERKYAQMPCRGCQLLSLMYIMK